MATKKTPAPAPASPPAATQPAPAPAPTSPTGYIDNPLTLLWQGWKALAHNVNTLVILALLFGVVIAVPVGIAIGVVAAFHNGGNDVIIDALVIFLAALIIIWLGSTLAVAYYRLALANARAQQVSLQDIWTVGQARWLVYFGASLLTGLAVLGGLILLIVPGIIFSVWFSLTALAVADGHDGAVAAMKHSRALLRGHGWEMFALLVVVSVLSGILEFIPVIGAIGVILLSVTVPTAYAIRYDQLTKLAGSAVPVPTPAP